MGNYKEIKGDLIALAKAGEFDVIGHGANCFSIMGAGIALQIRKEFRFAYLEDCNSNLSSIKKLGSYTKTISHRKNPFPVLHIYNLYTQYTPGPNLNYQALELSLLKMSMTLSKDKKIGLPMIGCGIAGGDWIKVKEIIQRVLSEFDVTIVIYNG